MLFDAARGKKLSGLGFCIGAIAGVTSNFFARMGSKLRLDDTLDVFLCHGIGSMVRLIMTGIFASKAVNAAAADGLAYGGTTLFLTHSLALVIVSAFALFKLTDLITPPRVTAEEEHLGLDMSQHEKRLLAGAPGPGTSRLKQLHF